MPRTNLYYAALPLWLTGKVTVKLLRKHKLLIKTRFNLLLRKHLWLPEVCLACKLRKGKDLRGYARVLLRWSGETSGLT